MIVLCLQRNRCSLVQDNSLMYCLINNIFSSMKGPLIVGTPIQRRLKQQWSAWESQTLSLVVLLKIIVRILSKNRMDNAYLPQKILSIDLMPW